LSWVEEEFPFCPLDYVLAVEGAFALRGSVARAIGANSKRFAAFPFVFDGGEDLVNKDGKITDTASNLWLPLWDRCVTYGELASFIEDAQARLPGKDVRFSAEFVRALHAQGVDAGFSGWQEFRFKLRGSDVPWTTTGPYTDGTVGRQRGSRPNATLLNVALAPLDDSRFLDQFDIAQMGKKLDPRNPRSVLGEVNEAMETAALEPTPDNCLALLESVFSSCRRMCISKSFREKLRGERASFFPPLPMEAWNDLLNPLDQRAEFRVARALASITGLQQQGNGDYSSVQPMLGSLLPVLKSGRSGWYLPENNERRQYVWTGENLLCDLAAVLRRRYLDSRDDEFPALRAVYGARLDDVLAFLRGELDDRLIARWTEALSLIGWQFTKDGANEVPSTPDESSGNSEFESMEPAYAALRTLLELECECQGNDRRQWKKRRSQQPLALLCERSASSLPLAVSEAFRWISIWGVPNAWGAASRAEKARISGEYVVRLDHWNISTALYTQQLADRLAAAVCIPLQWQDRRQLHRAVTIPPGI
jgi:CRISPR-associated protein Csx17